MNGDTFAGPHATARDPGKQISTPQLLEGIPRIQSLSGGRCHAVALTQAQEVLEWRAWASIFKVDDLPPSVAENIKQLEAGWSFSSLLTHSGDIYLWYSDWAEDSFYRTYYSGNMQQAMMAGEPPGHENQTVFPVNVHPFDCLHYLTRVRRQYRGRKSYTNCCRRRLPHRSHRFE